ncbi:MAG TPA: response regulator transcription factor [Nitrospira sp.]|nr:response regulator transcription factor [Nitrospira sp.]
MDRVAGAVRVLLVEDHAVVGEGVRLLLESYPNLEVVGRAGDGEEALAYVATLRPNVVVMDCNMPKMDGITATRLIRENYPHIAVVGLTVNTSTYAIHAMSQAGAFEVLLKEQAVPELYGAIQRAVASIQPVLILEEASDVDQVSPNPVNDDKNPPDESLVRAVNP